MLLLIYIVPSDDLYQVKRQWLSTFGVATTKSVGNKENKVKYFTTCYYCHILFKVKTKNKIVTYLVMRHRLSHFGEVTKKWYPFRDIQEQQLFGNFQMKSWSAQGQNK